MSRPRPSHHRPENHRNGKRSIPTAKIASSGLRAAITDKRRRARAATPKPILNVVFTIGRRRTCQQEDGSGGPPLAQPKKKRATFSRRHSPPRSLVESSPRRFDRAVDVGRCPFCHRGNRLPRRGILHGEPAPRSPRPPIGLLSASRPFGVCPRAGLAPRVARGPPCAFNGAHPARTRDEARSTASAVEGLAKVTSDQ